MPTAPLLLSALVLLVAGLRRHGRTLPVATAVGVAVVGCGFQVAHTIEHALQVAATVRRPGPTAWLSPWAAGLRDGLGGGAMGAEVLHLAGNLVFLAGLLALVSLVARGRWDVRSRGLVAAALVVQVVHVIEHVVLTASVALAGRPVGVTTAFGLLPAATTATTATVLRVGLHFTVNAVATGLLLAGLGGWRGQLHRPVKPGLRGPSSAARTSSLDRA